jgi:hypothetical protein
MTKMLKSKDLLERDKSFVFKTFNIETVLQYHAWALTAISDSLNHGKSTSQKIWGL